MDNLVCCLWNKSVMSVESYLQHKKITEISKNYQNLQLLTGWKLLRNRDESAKVVVQMKISIGMLPFVLYATLRIVIIIL